MAHKELKKLQDYIRKREITLFVLRKSPKCRIVFTEFEYFPDCKKLKKGNAS